VYRAGIVRMTNIVAMSDDPKYIVFPRVDDLRRQSVKDEDENQAQEHLHDRDREDDAGNHYMERD